MTIKHRLKLLAATFMTLAVVARAAPPDQSPQERLHHLTRIAANYRLTLSGKPVARLNEKPAIRWSKPAGEIEDAALYFWTSEGRPVAAGTFLWQKDVGLYHEFQSLTAGAIRGERDGSLVWESSRPGLVFAPVPSASVPVDSATNRQTQLKALAEEFRAEAIKEPPFYGKHSIYKFRLLPKPLLRYADLNRPELDGAVFAFAQDTDPEVLLILENRPHDRGTRWEYALAPMTGWELKAWHKDVEVWSIGNRHPGHDPTQPYFVAGPFPAQETSKGK